MRIAALILCLMVMACASVKPKVATLNSAIDSSLLVKRTSMWVPDLDEAIVFFRDVIGFEVESRKDLDLDPGSVLFDLFNVDPKADIRRVIFSGPSQQRVLFVMEAEGAPEYKAADKRASILLIRTDDMKGVVARAKAQGFTVGRTNVSTSPTSGSTFTETTIIGPAGNAVLMYQIA